MVDEKTGYRPWGHYTVVAEGNEYKTKIIYVNPGQKLSVQSHKHRSEHWVVAKGKARVILNNKSFFLEVGQSIDVPIEAIHSLQNPFEEDLEVVEVQLGKILAEEDITRYEDIYGRI
ncbi:phosphomannose isomerase type II C-terminal cupin domain [bacterium]|nr:phosphomannose isomerase type II C-terminal cupin domain [bacterium]